MKILDNGWSSQAKKKAWFGCLCLFVWSILIIFKFNIYLKFPITFIFYTLLLFNSFFSIRIFATITPKGHFSQRFWDFLLSLCFIFLPFFFNFPIDFVFLTLLLFVVATLKYVFLVQTIGFSKLLFEKIKIDTLGILLCLLCFSGILIGFTDMSLNLWTFVFFLANIYGLWYKPLYILENHTKKYIKK